MDADDEAAPDEPAVGIVWGVRDTGGPLLLVTDRTSLAEAERFGDFLTHLSSDIRKPSRGATENPSTPATVMPRPEPVRVSP